MENNTESTPSELATSIPSSERFHSMDMLRGVAILGILVMNIYAFAMPFAAYNNPTFMGGMDPLNLGTWFLTHLIFDQKFLAIFSMLYGAGMIMMLDRALKKGASFGRLFYRRSFWLLLFGMIHGYFIWFGDILFSYAVSGMIVFLWRKKSAKTLIITGIVFLLIGTALTVVSSGYMGKMKTLAIETEQILEQGGDLSEEQQQIKQQWDMNRAFMAPTTEDVAKDVKIHKESSYIELITHRIPQVAMMQLSGTFFFVLWRAGGLMLIGMGLMRLGIINGQRGSTFYRNMMLTGYAIGIPFMIYSSIDLYQHQFDNMYYFGWGMMPNYWGSIFIALGHVGLINYVHKSGLIESIMDRFSLIGRMAFTNYLSQSIILTTIFYGYGFNLYTEIPRFAQMGFVLVVILCQLYVSKWWLGRYRFGPAEWLWRSLTYWNKQPFRR